MESFAYAVHKKGRQTPQGRGVRSGAQQRRRRDARKSGCGVCVADARCGEALGQTLARSRESDGPEGLRQERLQERRQGRQGQSGERRQERDQERDQERQERGQDRISDDSASLREARGRGHGQGAFGR
jgi:hypothetical protein